MNMEINKDFVASVIIKDNGLLEYVEIKYPNGINISSAK